MECMGILGTLCICFSKESQALEDCELNFPHPPKKIELGLGERPCAELVNYAYYTICTLFFFFLLNIPYVHW